MATVTVRRLDVQQRGPFMHCLSGQCSAGEHRGLRWLLLRLR